MGQTRKGFRGAAINRFLDETNDDPKPFIWTADPDCIIAAVGRGHRVLDSIHYRSELFSSSAASSRNAGATWSRQPARMLAAIQAVGDGDGSRRWKIIVETGAPDPSSTSKRSPSSTGTSAGHGTRGAPSGTAISRTFRPRRIRTMLAASDGPRSDSLSSGPMQ